MKVDVCYIISHGFAARMLLQTNLIGRLTQEGHTVAIITPDVNDSNMKPFENNPQVCLVSWNSKSTIWDDDYLHKRMYYLEDIAKNTALKEKFYNGLFFSGSLHPWKRIRPLVYYMIYQLIKVFPSIRSRFIAREYKNLESDEALEIINRIQPRLVISTYPVSIVEAKVLYAAKANKIRTLQQLLSWDNITCKGKFPVVADEFIAWGEIMKKELEEYYGVKNGEVTTCGVPHFDQHIELRASDDYKNILQQFGLDPEKPFLFFAMSSPRFAPREIDIVEWLSKEVENNTFGNTLQLVVRPHPQNVESFMADQSWLNRLDELNQTRVAIDYPSLNKSKLRWSMQQNDMIHLSALMAGCSICLNSGSTISIEALIHNKPVILTSFDGAAKLPYWNSARRLIDYTHLKKLVETGGVTTVDSYDSLTKVISEYIVTPELNQAKRLETLEMQCFKDDGRSTDRVVKAISSTLMKV